MKMHRTVAAAAAVLLLALAGGSALGQPATKAPPSLDEFLADPGIIAPELSPNGRYVAFARYGEGQRSVLVYDLETDKVDQLLSATEDEGAYFQWLEWKDDTRLLVSVLVLKEKRRNNDETSRLRSLTFNTAIIAVDRATRAQTVMLREAPRMTRRPFNRSMVLDLLRNDPEHVLMLGYTPSGRPGIWKVDVRTGEGALVEIGGPYTDGWATDRDGNVVARYDSSPTGGWIALMARAPGQTEYVEAFRMKRKEIDQIPEVDFQSNAGKPGQIYALVKPANPSEGDTTALRIFDFQTRKMGPVVWSHPKYDLTSIVVDPRTFELRAACYTEDVERCEYLDPKMAATFKGLSRFFKGDRSIRLVSSSRDGQRSLLLVTGPNEPGTYYLYDWRKAEIEVFGETRPKLTPERLGVMQRVSWTARDGTALSGYLTLPPGSPAGALPLVVMPHGGPEVRDRFDYDTWVQFLATRGYAVFQPNFRGSYGFGRRFAEAGYGEWGGLMQTDVEDGVQALIDAGRVDAKRMCMFGASYGGYVALYAGASQPDRYRCIASFSGVSDLAESVERDGRYYGRDSFAYEYWVKSIGDPKRDRARLDARSPARMAGSFRAPVLLVHGEWDTNVVIDQSRAMEKALKRAGKPVKLLVLIEEGHSGWRDANKKLALGELEAFLAQHLGPAKPAT